MVLTNKERQARKHARKKENQEENKKILEKDRLRKAKSRAAAKMGMSSGEWAAYRATENARINAYRKREKEQSRAAQKDVDTRQKPYKSAQSMGRALNKVRSSLPCSPRKRKVVAAAVAKELGLDINAPSSSNIGRPALDPKTNAKVVEFYLKDDISWQAPGRKDRVIIRKKDASGKKIKTIIQARYMLMSLREAYDVYCTDNEKLLGISKFCDLRPKHIKLFDSIPHNVCVCSYHENVRLLLVALKCVTNLPDSTSSFTDMIVCRKDSKNCMSQKCQDCVNNIDKFAPLEATLESILKYQQWQNLNGAEKVEIVASVSDVFAELKRQVNPFLIHSYVKQSQSAYMDRLKRNVNGVNILIQVDFAENASLINQNEIQSAHWNHGQATVFTAHAWIDSNTNESLAIISNDLQHTKLSVHAYMTFIFSTLKEKYPSIAEINIFSDGAGSQFKQRYLFSNLYLWESIFSVQLRWNYFATSHGKGVVDGLGGTVKRSVWRYVRSGKGQANTPLEFYEIAVSRNPGMGIYYISAESIKQNKQMLEDHWSSTVPVPNTHNLHFVMPIDRCHLRVADTSDSIQLNEVRIKDADDEELMDESEDESCNEVDAMQPGDSELDLHVGDWVVVKYDGNEFPGEITDFVNDEIRVSVMHKSGQNWKWPLPKQDNIFYYKANVIRKIGLPIAVGHRGQFKFSTF